MIHRKHMHSLLPLIALTLALALPASVHAQNRHDQGSDGTPANLQVTFGSAPHWVGVPGTRVREIRQADRPDYDMFRYGGRYYAYKDNQWYMSRRSRGRFSVIDEQFVPNQLSTVPREHWHNYPASWLDSSGNPRSHGQGQRNSRNRNGQSRDNHDHN